MRRVGTLAEGRFPKRAGVAPGEGSTGGLHILLITSRFPYLPGEEFIEPEMEVLDGSRHDVTLLPIHSGVKERGFPSRFRLSRRLARRLHSPVRRLVGLARCLVEPWTYREIALNPVVLWHPRAALNFLRHVSAVQAILPELRRIVAEARKTRDHILIYSYWFDVGAYAAALCRKEGLVDVAIARAHGFDVFTERWPAGYMPLRRTLARHLDAIYAASEFSARYIRSHWRFLTARTYTSYLGVRSHGGLNPSPADVACFSVVSCTYLVAIKRVDMIVRAIDGYAAMHPDKHVVWTHIGDGPEGHRLRRLARALLGKRQNVAFRFLGNLPNSEVYRLYERERFSVFVSLSSTEGGCPVAISEAASFGIPIVATAVGGVPELVTAETGRIVSENPTESEVIQAFEDVLSFSDPQARIRTRDAIREKFDALRNHSVFLHNIEKLASEAL